MRQFPLFIFVSFSQCVNISICLLIWFFNFIDLKLIPWQFLAIAEGLQDIYRMGKEAAALHGALVADLSKVVTFFTV